ncbi:uncharacterized protein BXZ73DRAFT_77087 [Epithele typhae]|uniref:uncharacterized protein n=1 Tax=Epithele typhae TaxID=378194 RepID=UPI0020083C2E|nr:uncharacterized protein BXZ73DRAFT_77087 [Epithele typhae]KAH9933975.1 hypothetical protein BXZ73DRAFT_77087 [Epithele typhae]
MPANIRVEIPDRKDVHMQFFPIDFDDGEIYDIPAHFLKLPAPHPTEFLYLQHYSSTASSMDKALSACATAEEKVDMLVDEVAALNALMAGYFAVTRRMMCKFRDAHNQTVMDVEELFSSYQGVMTIAKHQMNIVDGGIDYLEKLDKAIYLGYPLPHPPPPPRILSREDTLPIGENADTGPSTFTSTPSANSSSSTKPSTSTSISTSSPDPTTSSNPTTVSNTSTSINPKMSATASSSATKPMDPIPIPHPFTDPPRAAPKPIAERFPKRTPREAETDTSRSYKTAAGVETAIQLQKETLTQEGVFVQIQHPPGPHLPEGAADGKAKGKARAVALSEEDEAIVAQKAALLGKTLDGVHKAMGEARNLHAEVANLLRWDDAKLKGLVFEMGVQHDAAQRQVSTAAGRAHLVRETAGEYLKWQQKSGFTLAEGSGFAREVFTAAVAARVAKTKALDDLCETPLFKNHKVTWSVNWGKAPDTVTRAEAIAMLKDVPLTFTLVPVDEKAKDEDAARKETNGAGPSARREQNPTKVRAAKAPAWSPKFGAEGDGAASTSEPAPQSEAKGPRAVSALVLPTVEEIDEDDEVERGDAVLMKLLSARRQPPSADVCGESSASALATASALAAAPVKSKASGKDKGKVTAPAPAPVTRRTKGRGKTRSGATAAAEDDASHPMVGAFSVAHPPRASTSSSGSAEASPTARASAGRTKRAAAVAGGSKSKSKATAVERAPRATKGKKRKAEEEPEVEVEEDGGEVKMGKTNEQAARPRAKRLRVQK